MARRTLEQDINFISTLIEVTMKKYGMYAQSRWLYASTMSMELKNILLSMDAPLDRYENFKASDETYLTALEMLKVVMCAEWRDHVAKQKYGEG